MCREGPCMLTCRSYDTLFGEGYWMLAPEEVTCKYGGSTFSVHHMEDDDDG